MLHREHVTDALRFWELARIGYNLVLVAVTIGAGFAAAGQCQDCAFQYFGANTALTLAMWVVVANIAYSTAYLPDIFVQNSDFRAQRLYWRLAIWLIGTVFASILAWACARTLFYPM